MKRKSIPVHRWEIYAVFTGILLLTYVFLSTRLLSLGYEMTRLEKRHEELTAVNRDRQARLLNMLSPAHFRRLVTIHGLYLAAPSEWKYVDIRVRTKPRRMGFGSENAEASIR